MSEDDTSGAPPQPSTPPTAGGAPRSRLEIAATIVAWVVLIFCILALVLAIFLANLVDTF
jgi:ABC-type Fe3+ transport system permease subunit